MKPLTVKEIGNRIDPAGDNDHVLAAAYNLALEHAAEHTEMLSQIDRESILSLKINNLSDGTLEAENE